MSLAPVQAFFLPAQYGGRLCLYHCPAHPAEDGAIESDCILHIHAFAEEMNRSRRMAALTARALAAQGCGVMQMDLFGCGDSAGDFGDARWEIWLDDIHVALNWLRQRHRGKLHLWGDRVGALLAMDFAAHHAGHAIDQLLLCQPILEGKSYLGRMNRLQLARQMLNQQGRSDLPTSSGTEYSGYKIAQELILSLEQKNALYWTLPVRQVHCLEIADDNAMPAERSAFFAHWIESGNPVQLHFVDGPAFWQTPETCQSQQWIDAFCRIFQKENCDSN